MITFNNGNRHYIGNNNIDIGAIFAQIRVNQQIKARKKKLKELKK